MNLMNPSCPRKKAKKVCNRIRKVLKEHSCFLSVGPEYALVDTAVGQALIRLLALFRLRLAQKELGLLVILISWQLPPDTPKVVAVVLVRTALSRVLGIVELAVLALPVPPLLPVQLLDALGTVVDLPGKLLRLQSL